MKRFIVSKNTSVAAHDLQHYCMYITQDRIPKIGLKTEWLREQ